MSRPTEADHFTRTLYHPCHCSGYDTTIISMQFIKYFSTAENYKLCTRPPQYAPAQPCNGSVQRLAELGPISQYAPSSQPAAYAAHTLDVRDRQTDRQTDVRQHYHLMPPARGHNKSHSNLQV